MKLYETPTTPNCLRVNIFLREKGLDIKRESIDVRAGDNLTTPFKQKSINGFVPVLELDSGEYICESIAICRYIEAIHPQPNLFGQTPEEIAKVEMWQRIIELQGITLIAQAIRNIKKIYQDRENCIEAWGREALLRFQHILPKLETQLTKQNYIAGQRFTVADISAYIMLKMSSLLDVNIDERWPSIMKWQETLSKRPAFQ